MEYFYYAANGRRFMSRGHRIGVPLYALIPAVYSAEQAAEIKYIRNLSTRDLPVRRARRVRA